MGGENSHTQRCLPARPGKVVGVAPVGLQLLMLGVSRDSYLYVPVGYRTQRSAPLALLLHGAGGHARQGLELLRYLADAAGLPLTRPGFVRAYVGPPQLLL